MVVQEGDEVGDGALEVDVVFPERVVGVDEQVLAGGKRLARGSHRWLMLNFSVNVEIARDSLASHYGAIWLSAVPLSSARPAVPLKLALMLPPGTRPQPRRSSALLLTVLDWITSVLPSRNSMLRRALTYNGAGDAAVRLFERRLDHGGAHLSRVGAVQVTAPVSAQIGRLGSSRSRLTQSRA